MIGTQCLAIFILIAFLLLYDTSQKKININYTHEHCYDLDLVECHYGISVHRSFESQYANI